MFGEGPTVVESYKEPNLNFELKMRYDIVVQNLPPQPAKITGGLPSVISLIIYIQELESRIRR